MMKQLFKLLMLALFLGQTAQAQQSWIRSYPDPLRFGAVSSPQVSKINTTPDGGFILSGWEYDAQVNSQNFLTKLNAWGGQEWKQVYPNPSYVGTMGVMSLADGYAVLEYDGLRKMDLFGNVVWSYTIPVFRNNRYFTQTAAGDFVLSHRNASNQLQLFKISAAGALQWQVTLTGSNNNTMPGDIIEASNGEIWMAVAYYNGSSSNPQSTLAVWKVSAAGASLGTTNLPSGVVPALVWKVDMSRRNGNYLFQCQQSGGQRISYLKSYDNTLALQWQNSHQNTANSSYQVEDMTQNNLGTIVLAGRVDSNNNSYAWAAGFDPQNGNRIWSRSYPNPYMPFNYGGLAQVEPIGNHGFIMMRNDSASVLYRTDSLGRIEYSNISGTLFLDLNNNCVYDAGDSLLRNQIIRTQLPSGTLVHATSDQNGYYSLDLPAGTYTLAVPHPYNPAFWTSCSSVNNIALGQNQNLQINLGLQALGNCPMLSVDIETPFLRRCFNSTYYVRYRNVGFVAATGAYVDVTFDAYLSYLSAQIPGTALGNNTYRFQLGTVNVGQQGSFWIRVTDSCRSVLGQVHCTDARIYPDTFCINNWTGPIINTSGNCLGDSVQFRIRNTGGNMGQPLDYLVIEDNVMLRQGNFQLNTNQDLFLSVPAQSQKVYRIEARQEVGFPSYLGDSIAWTNLRNCPDSTPFIWSALVQYYSNNSNPFLDTDCEPNRGSYDPNDKTASPVGYGQDHNISPGTPLDYMIRFQNTGTDTAFRVVIVDTLSAQLNPSSLQMGASSHPYTWELREDGILRITFFPIALTDTFTNIQESMGFVSFRIQHDAGLALGTRIENTAAIYFDYNEPIFTNTTFHTLAEDFIQVVVGTEQVEWTKATVKAIPNPFQFETVLTVEGQEFGQLELRVMDASGRLVKQAFGQGNQVRLGAEGLVQGLYFYQLYADGQFLNAGKVILNN